MESKSLAEQELRSLCSHPRLRLHLPNLPNATLEDVLAELLPYGRVSFRQVNGPVPANKVIGCVLRLRSANGEDEGPQIVVNASAVNDSLVGSGSTLMLAALRCLLKLLARVDSEVKTGLSEFQLFLESH